MVGVITRREVLAHPIVIFQGFGARVLVRALTSAGGETFLDIVNRCADEAAHRGLADVDFSRTVGRFVDFETRARDLYAALADRPLASAGRTFFRALAAQEESHAILLAHVRREAKRGHCWKSSQRDYRRELCSVNELLTRLEAEARGPVSLARSLEMVEALEGSELDVVFDTLRHSVDRRSLARLERFFVISEAHQDFCAQQVDALRAAHGLRTADGGASAQMNRPASDNGPRPTTHP